MSRKNYFFLLFTFYFGFFTKNRIKTKGKRQYVLPQILLKDSIHSLTVVFIIVLIDNIMGNF